MWPKCERAICGNTRKPDFVRQIQCDSTTGHFLFDASFAPLGVGRQSDEQESDFWLLPYSGAFSDSACDQRPVGQWYSVGVWPESPASNLTSSQSLSLGLSFPVLLNGHHNGTFLTALL